MPRRTSRPVPADGYKFSAWTGASTSTTSPLALPMDADKTISATFVPDNADSDGDGISNYDEVVLYGTLPGSSPASVPPLPGNVVVESTITGLPGAEISAFDPVSDRLFVTSGAGLTVVNLANPAAPSIVATIDFTASPIGAVSNDISSVAVYGGKVAAAVLNPNKEAAGQVVFFDAATATTPAGFLGKVSVGITLTTFASRPTGRRSLWPTKGSGYSIQTWQRIIPRTRALELELETLQAPSASSTSWAGSLMRPR